MGRASPRRFIDRFPLALSCPLFLRLPYAHFLALTQSIWPFILCRQSHGGCRVQQHRGEFPHDLFQLRVRIRNSRVSVSRRDKTSRNSRFSRKMCRAAPNRSNISRNSSSVTGFGGGRGSGLGRFSSGGFFPHRSSPISRVVDITLAAALFLGVVSFEVGCFGSSTGCRWRDGFCCR